MHAFLDINCMGLLRKNGLYDVDTDFPCRGKNLTASAWVPETKCFFWLKRTLWSFGIQLFENYLSWPQVPEVKGKDDCQFLSSWHVMVTGSRQLSSWLSIWTLDVCDQEGGGMLGVVHGNPSTAWSSEITSKWRLGIKGSNLMVCSWQGWCRERRCTVLFI